MRKQFIKYIVSAAVLLAVCLWVLPPVPLADADLDVAKIEVIQLNGMLLEPVQYTFTEVDAEYEEILTVLRNHSAHRCVHTLFGADAIDGQRAGYWQLIYLWTDAVEDGPVSISCSGTGEILIEDGVYHMGARKQLQMMESLRQIYES